MDPRGRHPTTEAQETLQQLPDQMLEATVVCPLCAASVPARGLREKPGLKAPFRRWEILFHCPACGLISSFSVENVSRKRLKTLQGSAWTSKLRQFMMVHDEGELRQQPATISHFAAVFAVSFLTALLLAGSLAPIDVVWALVASALVARFSYRQVAFDPPRWIWQPRRWLPFAGLVIEFFRQLIVQNISLSIRVLRPNLRVTPGIVAIPTRLDSEVDLTILGSLLSLTPDTVTMDIDQTRGMIYVHWIDVQTTDPGEAQEVIAADLEQRIVRWLH